MLDDKSLSQVLMTEPFSCRPNFHHVCGSITAAAEPIRPNQCNQCNHDFNGLKIHISLGPKRFLPPREQTNTAQWNIEAQRKRKPNKPKPLHVTWQFLWQQRFLVEGNQQRETTNIIGQQVNVSTCWFANSNVWSDKISFALLSKASRSDPVKLH